MTSETKYIYVVFNINQAKVEISFTSFYTAVEWFLTNVIKPYFEIHKDEENSLSEHPDSEEIDNLLDRFEYEIIMTELQ